MNGRTDKRAHPGGGTRRRRAIAGAAGALFVALLIALLLPVTGIVLVQYDAVAQAVAQQETNPRADYWRTVRGGVEGYTAVRGQETNVLIQSSGQDWRTTRSGPVLTYGGWFLAAVVLGIALFYAIRGRIRLEQGRSGQRILRWTVGERLMHWYTAVLFILLAITGLSLLLGRELLIPLIGRPAFAAYAEVAKTIHNILGPLFILGILMEIVYWMKFNLFRREDWEWFKQGGGILGRSHPSAGKFNGGEKVWFWVIFVVGLTVSVSGLILDFPNFGQTRETMQLANVIHAIGAIIFTAFALGHIYIGTIGTEGALEGMTTGYVDVNWAKQHHDAWYEEKTRRAGKEAIGEPGAAPTVRGPQPTT